MGTGKGGIKDDSQVSVGARREYPAQPLAEQVWKLRARVRRILSRVTQPACDPDMNSHCLQPSYTCVKTL